MTREELKTILELHKRWINFIKGGCLADLSYADLRGANLRNADLRNADLSDADLSDADLSYADLRYADLRYANLNCANLRGANLRNANLRNADLRNADLRGANLRNCIGISQTFVAPEIGSYTGFKKLKNNLIATLEIPSHAKRSNATGRKCRASEVIVISIEDKDGNSFNYGISNYENDFIYTVGETVVINNFDDNRWEECTTGIHHFITKQEAIEY